MNPKVANRLADVHPQMLRAEGEGRRKELADLRPVIGELVSRALQLAGVTKQEAAFRMRYSDPGTVSRWCSGVERPAFDKLFTIEGFEVAWVLAIAERNRGIVVETVVRIRRRA